MPDDDLHFSRSGTSHFGKLTADVKTRLSEDEKADLMRAAHLMGMSESEFVREITGVASTDWSMSKGYAAERLEAVAGKGVAAGTAKGDGS